MYKKIILAAFCLPLITACNPDGSMTKAETGALIGGIAGAALGKGTSNHKSKRAVIGGIAGAALGATIGAYMDNQERELRQVTEGTGIDVQRVGDEITLNMPDSITFDTASWRIKSAAYDALDNLARTLSKFEDTDIVISGHTDDTGTEDFNQKLSEKRAYHVKKYLASQGVASYRIHAIGYGEDRPIADNRSRYGRAQNRRVEIRLHPHSRRQT